MFFDDLCKRFARHYSFFRGGVLHPLRLWPWHCGECQLAVFLLSSARWRKKRKLPLSSAAAEQTHKDFQLGHLSSQANWPDFFADEEWNWNCFSQYDLYNHHLTNCFSLAPVRVGTRKQSGEVRVTGLCVFRDLRTWKQLSATSRSVGQVDTLGFRQRP